MQFFKMRKDGLYLKALLSWKNAHREGKINVHFSRNFWKAVDKRTLYRIYLIMTALLISTAI